MLSSAPLETPVSGGVFCMVWKRRADAGDSKFSLQYFVHCDILY